MLIAVILALVPFLEALGSMHWIPTATAGARPVAVSAAPVFAGVTDVDLTMLVSIDYEEGKPLPRKIVELDGEFIRIQGYMDPTTEEGLTQFWLVADDCGCQGQNVHHFIEVTLAEGKVSYRPELITLEGEFDVGEVKEDGFVVSLYRLHIERLD